MSQILPTIAIGVHNSRARTIWLPLIALFCAVSSPIFTQAAVVAVDTRGGAAPPTRPTAPTNVITHTPAGIPVNFKFYAQRMEPDAPLDIAIKHAVVNLDRRQGPQGTGVIEGTSVWNLMTNPSLYVGEDGFDVDELVPNDWAQVLDKRQSILAGILRATGRIQVYHANTPEDAESRIIGTGFLVARNVVMTNRHVAREFCRINTADYPFRRDFRNANDAQVKINFSGTRDNEPDLCPVKRVLFFEPLTPGSDDEWSSQDVALLEIDESFSDTIRAPLPLQAVAPAESKPGRRFMVCGYPTTGCPYDLLQTIRVKRLSLGNFVQAMNWHGNQRLYHNCLTGGGSSGSPVVDLDTGTVWGLHFYFEFPQNIAEPMWEICKIAKVQELLGDAATKEPPEVEAPLEDVHEEDVVEPMQVSRPVRFMCGHDFQAGQTIPDGWMANGSPQHERLRAACRSVGRISHISVIANQRDPDPLAPLATGFVIAGRLVIVPAFVELLLRLDGGRPLFIEFNRSACLEEPIVDQKAQRFQLEAVKSRIADNPVTNSWRLYRILTNGIDEPPPPLRILANKPVRNWVESRVYVLGHPTQDSRIPETVFTRVFPPPFGVKRIAFGRVIESQGERAGQELWHDCSTSAGDAGAPLIDLDSGAAIGIHTSGIYLKGNQAIPMWEVLADPELQSVPEIQALIDSQH